MSKNENVAFSSSLICVMLFLNVTASDSSSCSSTMLVDGLLITAAASEGEDYVVHCECLQDTQGVQARDRYNTSFTNGCLPGKQASKLANVRNHTPVRIM